MSTFLAPDRIALFQQDFLVAVAADVLCGEAYCIFGRSGIKGGLRRGIGFAGHFDDRCSVGEQLQV